VIYILLVINCAGARWSRVSRQAGYSYQRPNVPFSLPTERGSQQRYPSSQPTQGLSFAASPSGDFPNFPIIGDVIKLSGPAEGSSFATASSSASASASSGTFIGQQNYPSQSSVSTVSYPSTSGYPSVTPGYSSATPGYGMIGDFLFSKKLQINVRLDYEMRHVGSVGGRRQSDVVGARDWPLS
ncbi:hypothetical protein ALC60_09952, partial [Trachymyrmex zeteki]